MKRLISFFLIILSAAGIFAESDRIIRFEAGISSGYIFYGDSQIKEQHQEFNNGVSNRFLIGPVAALSLKAAKPLKITVGADSLLDMVWNGKDFIRHFDYDVYGGVKWYPGLKGFNVSAAYCGGQRIDFSNVPDIAPKLAFTEWGNGFRLALEYDWLYESKNEVMPAAGICYRFIPRGDYHYDNLLTAYLLICY